MHSDNQTTRLFLGIPLPEAMREEMARLAQSLQAAGVRAGNWSRPDLYHLTLVFLGELDAQQRTQVMESAAAIASRHGSGTLTLSAVGAFARSRILWAGIRDEEERHWGRLAADLAEEVRTKAGLSIERRPFRAHITLARKLESQPPLADQMSRAEAETLPGATCDVSAFALFASRREEGRLVYPVEQVFPLRRNG